MSDRYCAEGEDCSCHPHADGDAACVADRAANIERLEGELEDCNNLIDYYTGMIEMLNCIKNPTKELADRFNDPECIKIVSSQIFDGGQAEAYLEKIDASISDYKNMQAEQEANKASIQESIAAEESRECIGGC